MQLKKKKKKRKNRWNRRLRWIKKGHRKGGWFFWQRRTCMWSRFAYVASLQGKGARKHKQQWSSSWRREAVVCVPRPPYAKQWIQWRTGLWHRNTRLLQLREAIAFLRLHLRSVNIYPTGKHTSFHSFCTETTVELPPSQRNDVRPWGERCLGLESRCGCWE